MVRRAVCKGAACRSQGIAGATSAPRFSLRLLLCPQFALILRTLPEYVCSSAPLIRTEGDKESSDSNKAVAWAASGLAAFTAVEEAHVAEVREYYRAQVGQIRPMWLRPGGRLSEQLDMDAWELYRRVEKLLNCTVAADRIRAAYPLFFCVPVENHEDMCSLVGAVAERLEAHDPGSVGAVTARRHHDEIMGAAVKDEVQLYGDEIQRDSMLTSVYRAASSAVAASGLSALHNLTGSTRNVANRSFSAQ